MDYPSRLDYLENNMEQTVATFYQFAHLPDCLEWQKKLRTQCKKLNVLGTIILAEEGINATLSSNAKSIGEIMAFIKKDERFASMPFRTSVTPRQTFYRIRVAVRKEIVTLGDASVNPNDQVGTYIEPKEWNKIIQDPDVLTIDTRNDYEVEIGTFKGSVDPKTQNFGLIKHKYKPNLLIDNKDLPLKINKMEKNKIVINANPGDIVVFNCFTLHRSEQAKLDKVRSVIQITYTDISEVDMTDNLFFLNSEFDAFAKKDKSLNSTLK